MKNSEILKINMKIAELQAIIPLPKYKCIVCGKVSERHMASNLCDSCYIDSMEND